MISIWTNQSLHFAAYDKSQTGGVSEKSRPASPEGSKFSFLIFDFVISNYVFGQRKKWICVHNSRKWNSLAENYYAHANKPNLRGWMKRNS